MTEAPLGARPQLVAASTPSRARLSPRGPHHARRIPQWRSSWSDPATHQQFLPRSASAPRWRARVGVDSGDSGECDYSSSTAASVYTRFTASTARRIALEYACVVLLRRTLRVLHPPLGVEFQMRRVGR